MELQGKIAVVMPQRNGTSAKGDWCSQEFVMEYTDGTRQKKICFEVFGSDNLVKFNIVQGDVLKVHFDIDAHQWKERWFNSVRCYNVEHIGQQPQGNQPVYPQQGYAQPQQPVTPVITQPINPQQYVQNTPVPGQKDSSLPF